MKIVVICHVPETLRKGIRNLMIDELTGQGAVVPDLDFKKTTRQRGGNRGV